MAYRPLFTASRLDAIIRCPGAATLPFIEEQPRDEAIPLAGSTEHATVLTAESLPENLRNWLLTGGAPASAIIFEQPFIVDWIQGQSVLVSAYREEVTSALFTGGTPDVFTAYTVEANGRRSVHVRVPDLKTGAGQAVGCLRPPAESWQLRYYALAILLWLGWPESAELGECRVAFWTRDYEAERLAEPDLEPDEREHLWRIIEADLSDGLLRESVERLRELTRQLTSRPGELWREGPWCEGCSAFKACPVQTSPVARLGVALEDGKLSDEKIAAVDAALPAVRRLVEQAERVRERYVAAHGPVRTKTGGLLVRERVTRERLGAAALPVLRSIYPDQFGAMVRESVSKSSVARALGEKVPGALTEEALGKLREVPGAIEESVSFELRERRDRSE